MADNIDKIIVDHQKADPSLGAFFEMLTLFASRTIKEFFSDTPSMPVPIISLEPEHGDRRASYRPVDGLTLRNRINLNPMVLRDGEDAAVSLAHELVHLWQDHVGSPLAHDEAFEARLLSIGIRTAGPKAITIGFEVSWESWLAENDDLNLKQFILPGSERKSKRRMLKHQCPDCGASFHCRRELNVMCMDCTVPYEV